MPMIKQFVVFVLCVALCTPAAFAQDQPKPVRPGRVDADVTIIIQPQQVRFIAPKPGEELQLQVYDQNGVLIHDSGVSFAGEINWPLINANGEALKSGLYAYTLTRKESSEKTARVRRGHFIVDRNADRDSADKLWVTSQSDDKVGVELTAAQTESGAVTGVRLPGTDGGSETPREKAEEKDNPKKADALPTDAASVSTVGRIAKFIGANNELGDSIITETSGLLDVNGSMRLAVAPNSANNGVITFGTPNSEAGVTITKDTGRADFRFNGSSLKLVAGPAGGPPSDFSGVAVTTAGNVGIGTTTPANKLDVNGGIRAFFNSSTGMVAETTGGTNAWARFHMNTLRQRWFMGTSNNFNGDQFYLWDETANQPRFTIQPNSGAIAMPLGNVGIGTATPQYRLHVGSGTSSIAASRVDAVFAGNRGDAGIAIAQNSGVNLLLQASGAGAYLGTTSNHPLIWRTNDQDRVVLAANGNLGIGTGLPATRLHVEGAGVVEATIRSTNERAILALDSNPVGIAGRTVWTLESGVGGTAGVFGIYQRGAGLARLRIFPTGLVSLGSLELTGGSDFSENFDIGAQTANGGAVSLKPGMVVSINPAQPGKLLLSARAYDRRVAGIVSGAGDVKPGLVMGQEGTAAHGRHPVALSGRVYVWADATRAAIRPGDLLTTSHTPGHAMKVANSTRAQGAIIGKAMTGLKTGKGLVLVLVTLQ